jgi:hypothetical protein
MKGIQLGVDYMWPPTAFLTHSGRPYILKDAEQLEGFETPELRFSCLVTPTELYRNSRVLTRVISHTKKI